MGEDATLGIDGIGDAMGVRDGEALPSFDDGESRRSWRFVIDAPDTQDAEDAIASRVVDALGAVAGTQAVVRCGETLRGRRCMLGCVSSGAIGDEALRGALGDAIGSVAGGASQSAGGCRVVSVDEIDQRTASDVMDYLRRAGRYAGRKPSGALHERGCAPATVTGDDVAACGAGARDAGEPSVVAIALETTGMDAVTCEIVRLAAYGDYGRVMYDRTFGVEHPERWSEQAQDVSGLHPGDVDGLPTFRECLGTDGGLASLLSDTDIVIGHNVPYVVGFLSAAGVRLDDKRFGDTCACFGRYAMQRKLYNATRRLSTAAHAFKIPVPQRGHTDEKAHVTYSVWLTLVRRGASELMGIDQLRDRQRRKDAKRRKRSAGKR